MSEQEELFNAVAVGARGKRRRERMHLSIEKLAKLAEVNKNTVVNFEKGKTTNINTILKICKALNTTPFHLMDGKLEQELDYKLVKRKNRKKIKRKDRAYSIDKQMLIGDLKYKLPGGQINANVFEISGEGTWRSHPGEEMFFCLTGKVGVRIAHEEFILEKGDAIFFWGEERHQYFNAYENKKSVALGVWIDKDAKLQEIEYFEDKKK